MGRDSISPINNGFSCRSILHLKVSRKILYIPQRGLSIENLVSGGFPRIFPRSFQYFRMKPPVPSSGIALLRTNPHEFARPQPGDQRGAVGHRPGEIQAADRQILPLVKIRSGQPYKAVRPAEGGGVFVVGVMAGVAVHDLHPVQVGGGAGLHAAAAGVGLGHEPAKLLRQGLQPFLIQRKFENI